MRTLTARGSLSHYLLGLLIVFLSLPAVAKMPIGINTNEAMEVDASQCLLLIG